MRNIIDYVQEEMTRLDDKPFNSVDSLVLSQFSYIDFSDLVPSSRHRKNTVPLASILKAEFFEGLFKNVRDPDSNRRLLFALAASPRFRDIRVGFYTSEWDTKTEKQFAATTFFLDKKTAYVAFRGTDATLIGWKEDFNMAFQSPIPSQTAAVQYVRTVASKWSGKLMLGGHSKGGNLAIYAAVRSTPDIQKRLLRIDSHDGPGFKKNTFAPSEFARIEQRIVKTLPQSSIIGMLLENHEDYSIVKSSRLGLMQHDPFSWKIEGDHFAVEDHLTAQARHTDRTLHEWLSTLTDDKRERFVDTLYAILEAGKIQDLTQLGQDWQHSVSAMLDTVRNIDATTRSFLRQTIRDLTSSAIKNIYSQKLPDDKSGAAD